MNFEILVNKKNPLSSDYVPEDLIITDQNENNFHHYVDPTLKPMIHFYVFEQFEKMKKAAQKENLSIIIDSGYRSYEYQKKIYEIALQEKGIEHTKKFIAPPGASEHQTGLAIDIGAFRNHIYTDDIKEQDKETKWLEKNAYQYGFILRYPKGKEKITGYAYEPWHYRYVGKNLATYLYQNHLTLEEYYEQR